MSARPARTLAPSGVHPAALAYTHLDFFPTLEAMLLLLEVLYPRGSGSASLPDVAAAVVVVVVGRRGLDTATGSPFPPPPTLSSPAEATACTLSGTPSSTGLDGAEAKDAAEALETLPLSR